MHENLRQLYERTEGFTKVPRELSPGGLGNIGRALIRNNSRQVARGTLDRGESYEVYQALGQPDVWMNIYRSDGTLSECQHFHPFAQVYSLTSMRYDYIGKEPTHFTAQTPDGRVVEMMTRKEDGWDRTYHLYPDVRDLFYNESLKYDSSLTCHKSTERFYHDREGKRLELVRRIEDGSILWEVMYHEDGIHEAIIKENHRNSNKPARIRAYTDTGLLETQETFDRYGRLERYTEYYTNTVARAGEQKKKIEKIYRDGVVQTEHYYSEDGVEQSHVICKYDPKNSRLAARIRYTSSGVKMSEQQYDDKGRTTSFVTYYTDDIDDPRNPPVKTRQTYKDGVIESEFGYHRDGVLRYRKDCEKDGKHFKLHQIYNATGEYPVDIRTYKNGKIAKQVLLERDGDQSRVKRIFLFDEEGNPYRSREHYHWEGDRFWGETEIDRETRYSTSSIVPAPSGLIRHSYDPKTGRLKLTETYSEPELGETRRLATHYYPAPPAALHPEQRIPLAVHKVEHFDESGEEVTRTNTYRKDHSVKFREWRDDEGRWIRRAYAPGTRGADDDAPFIFESVTGTEGTLERSSLRAHADPSIIALHKEYDESGKPVQVTLETLDDEETLSWEEYTERKTQERLAQPGGAVRLATIAPGNAGQRKGEELYNGSTVATLQGSEWALRKAQSQLIRRFPDIRCELCTGDRRWEQYRGETGHYYDGPPNSKHKDALEKVNVLKVVMPYPPRDDEQWPRSFRRAPESSEALRDCRRRAHEEAVEALKQIYRYTSCDLGLDIRPVLLRHAGKDKQNPVFEASVAIRWPSAPYLSDWHGTAICDVLLQQLDKGRFSSRLVADEGTICIDTGIMTGVRKDAEKEAHAARKRLVERLVPASARRQPRSGGNER